MKFYFKSPLDVSSGYSKDILTININHDAKSFFELDEKKMVILKENT